MYKQYIMLPSIYQKYINRGFNPHCRQCKILIEENDEYVRNRSYSPKYPKLLCIKCAKELYII